MKIFKIILLSVMAFIIIAGVIGLFLPTAQHVERQITINAPLNKVFPYINDFRKFNQWSPWAKIDPSTEYTFTGAEKGKGAKIQWTSVHEHVGKGSQEILESNGVDFVKTSLDFGTGEPATAQFNLSEANGQTTVIWAFDTYFDKTISRYFGLMLDKWVGQSYEEGLVNLKTLLESQ
ncbi:MAG: SRPBCC family protein [Arenicellales bacterium]